MDASLYSPDPSLVPRYVAYLSQRDLSYSTPVNFVPQPGVALSAACFANKKYEDAAGIKCISNLLESGFRRLEADIFWDASIGHWNLCPVELGSSSQLPTISTSVLPTETAAPLTSAYLNERQNGQLTSQSPSTSLSSLSVADASSTQTLSADATTTALAGAGTTMAYTDGSAAQIGNFTCTSTTDFDLLLTLLSARLSDTGTDLNATTLYLTLNIHAAASISAPAGSAQQPADEFLPSPDNSLSAIISRNISNRVYTPTELLTQRQKLNNSRSWFTVNPAEQPDSSYFQVITSGSESSSPDGWPGEAYVEMSAAKRLFIEFGQIDPQMRDYDLALDSSTIFPPGSFSNPTQTTFRSNGTIDRGCFFNPGIRSVAEANNSWATHSTGGAAASQDFSMSLTYAKSLTDCGISPFLNETLGSTADESYAPYLAFVESTIWSWGPDQPINSSLREDLNDYRCAALNATSGMWLASDCGTSRYGACRISSQPYEWKISYAATPYDRIDLACDDGSAFDVPRTSLENSHLLSTWRSYIDDQDDDRGTLLWLDFNQLDISACWVIGANSTCPYTDSPSEETRRIVVPVVGAIVVFVLAALTVLIKCAGNRQTAKRRRRRGDDNWDYEGVPS